MTKDEMRQVIAERVGFKIVPVIVKGGWALYNPLTQEKTSFWWRGSGEPTILACLECVPNYPEDLDAMHEAFISLSYTEQSLFYVRLKEIVERDNPGTHVRLCDIVNATATQRAEAFIRTIGKWEEAKLI